MSKKADAVIIGCGIIGNCIAFELAKKGFKTLSVDRNGDSGAGSTAGSCAIVRAHYSTLEGVAFAWEGFGIWQNWEEYCEVQDDWGMAKYRQCGSVMVKSRDRNWKKILEHWDTVGVPYENWDADTMTERLPILSKTEFWPPSRPEADEDFFGEKEAVLEGALYCPSAGYMSDPKLSTHNVQVAAEARGAEFIFNAEVVEIIREDNQVTGVKLKDGTVIETGIVVNVAGPHSSIINNMAGVEEKNNIKTRAERHEVAYVPSPAGFDFEAGGVQISDGDNGIYMRPEVGNNILVGSEDPRCDTHQWVEDPDEFNRNTTDAQWTAQIYRAARRLPDLGIPNMHKGFAELYDVSSDWLPIYDKSDLGGFYMACGSSGNQYKNAPVAGMMMSELIEQCEKEGLNHDKYPLQFTLPTTGVTLDMGAFSRNRELNPNSTYSVIG
ncbi:MAG: FAD-binding oxidoreductase [Desulfobacterales bacterium]|nr:FAD-binding oxidoreductase [Desulfobacterales bacterium]